MRWNLKEAVSKSLVRRTEIAYKARLREISWRKTTKSNEEQFHDHSYGFRPNRCAQQAILMALDMMNDGNDWIVDIDLEKFFDTVNHA